MSDVPVNDKSDQALSMIQQGASPLDIRRLFPSYKEAVRFYGSVRARQFGYVNVIQTCSECDQVASDVVVEFQWSAKFVRFSYVHIVLLFAGHIGRLFKFERFRFSTFHGFCMPCWHQFKRSQKVKNIVEPVSILLIIAGAIVSLVCGLLLVSNLRQPDYSDSMEFLCYFVGSIGAEVAFMLLWFSCMSMGNPASLQPLFPRPFKLEFTEPMRAVEVAGSTARQLVHVPIYRKDDRRSLSWQQGVAIVIGIFGGITGALLAFAPEMGPPYRLVGWVILSSTAALIALFVVMHGREQSNLRETYYKGMAAQIARVQQRQR